MGIIDTVIILLFIVFMVIGFIRGFIKQVLSGLAWVIAMVVAALLCGNIASMLLGTNIGINLNNAFYEWISNKGELFTTVIPSLTEDYLSEILLELGIPNFLHNLIISVIDVSTFENNSIAGFVGPEITKLLLTIVSFIVIYLVVFLVVKLISSLCSHIVKGSALGFIDSTLGLLWGAVKMAIIVSILMLVLSLVVSMPFGEAVNEWITADMKLGEEGFGIGKFFYENNPILFVISKIPFNK